MINLQYSEYPSFIFIVFLSNKQLMLSDSRADFWTAATARTVSRSPWTALRPGVVQHGEFHSAEHAGGETVSMAITSVLSRRYARRVSLRILHWLKTKNIRIIVNLLGMCMPQRSSTGTARAAVVPRGVPACRGAARPHVSSAANPPQLWWPKYRVI